MKQDTIAAIATPLGESSIAIIRVSGDEAVSIVDMVFKGKQCLAEVHSHTVSYGHITHLTGELVDEVLVTVMRAPRSFTREDVVEISCHGGVLPVQKVMEVVLSNGARLAEPGEFTKRAFLNGRIDLSQAEAVIDIICAKTDQAAKIAQGQAAGKLSNMIRMLRHQMVEMLAHLAVNVDYPEYDADELTEKKVRQDAFNIQQEIENILETARQGKIYREGIATAIIGRPNVGKSSLLNVFAGENKAIVTAIPGTTRDTIEEYVNVRGIPLCLVDTAGIRETDDIVERLGVERSRQAIAQAELIIFVFNHNEPLHEEEIALLKSLQGRQVICVVNKVDLANSLDIEALTKLIGEHPVVYISLLEDKGVDMLKEAIEKIFGLGEISTAEGTYVSNARHIQLLKQALESIAEGIKGIDQQVPLDMIEIDIKNAWGYLGEVIGEEVGEDLLDQIFSQFCLGK